MPDSSKDEKQTSLEDKTAPKTAKAAKSAKDDKPAPAPAKADHVPEDQVKNFEVLEDCEIPRGASTFRLRKGKIVQRGSYDIRHLKAVGAKLKARPDLG